MSTETHLGNGELEWGILYLEVSNTVNQSSEELELQGWVTALKHILGAFQGSRWLAQLF